MSSVFSLDDDPIVLVVPSSASIPPGDISEAEWLQLKDRVTVVEGRFDLGDLNDVDTTGIIDGQTIIYDADTEMFIAGSSGGTIARVDADGGGDVRDVARLFARYGITVVDSGFPGVAYIQPLYGTTANTVAAGNHAHTQPLPTRVTTPPLGYISGGSQSFTPTSVTLPDGIPCIVAARLTGQFRGADTGAAYYTLSINIGGNTFTSPGGTGGFWCVQGVPDKIQWEHEQKITGAGTAVPVSASVAWHSGSGFNIDRTYLTVTVRRDR